MWHKKCGVLGWICLILIIIGGINWGLVGIFGFNLVTFLFGAWPIVERIIYIVVGIAAVIAIFTACRCCGGGGDRCEHRHTHVPPTTGGYNNPDNRV
jgi:uncharacterized protein